MNLNANNGNKNYNLNELVNKNIELITNLSYSVYFFLI